MRISPRQWNASSEREEIEGAAPVTSDVQNEAKVFGRASPLVIGLSRILAICMTQLLRCLKREMKSLK
jgi:hypothetical protein